MVGGEAVTGVSKTFSGLGDRQSPGLARCRLPARGLVSAGPAGQIRVRLARPWVPLRIAAPAAAGRDAAEGRAEPRMARLAPR
jgi:hypothetical protein